MPHPISPEVAQIQGFLSLVVAISRFLAARSGNTWDDGAVDLIEFAATHPDVIAFVLLVRQKVTGGMTTAEAMTAALVGTSP